MKFLVDIIFRDFWDPGVIFDEKSESAIRFDLADPEQGQPGLDCAHFDLKSALK